MLSARFGELHATSTQDNGPGAIYDWTLQVQCPWRISQGTRIVIAYRDFYYSDVPLKNLAVMNKSHSNSVLETLCAEFEARPPRVASIKVEKTGDFSIELGGDYHLEIFPAESTESGKHWRIYEAGAGGRSFVFPPSEES